MWCQSINHNSIITILHLTNGELENGSVTGYLNAARRNQIMDHHTSVHIVGGSARKILGPHIWQAGSNKGERYARLDVTHYERLTRSQLDEIEDHANEIIQSDTSVEKLVLNKKGKFLEYAGGAGLGGVAEGASMGMGAAKFAKDMGKM